MPGEPLSRKRLATRRAISDTATHLFYERGFDRVTVDEIAKAAGVGRMTVFNHFARKEDMFFDLDEYGRIDLLMALRQRDPSESPLETLRRFAHRVVEEHMPYVRFSPASQKFFETIAASAQLKARARAIRDELAQLLAVALSEIVGRGPDDPDAHLAAGLLIMTWGIAFVQAHGVFRRSQNAAEAQAVFLTFVDRGMLGLKTTMAETPYG